MPISPATVVKVTNPSTPAAMPKIRIQRILLIGDYKFDSKKLKSSLFLYKDIVEYLHGAFKDLSPRLFNPSINYMYIDVSRSENATYLERHLFEFRAQGWIIFAIPRKPSARWVDSIKPDVCIVKKEIGILQKCTTQDSLKSVLTEYENTIRIAMDTRCWGLFKKKK